MSVSPIIMGSNVFVPVYTHSHLDGKTRYENINQLKTLLVDTNDGSITAKGKSGQELDILTKFGDLKQMDVKA